MLKRALRRFFSVLTTYVLMRNKNIFTHSYLEVCLLHIVYYKLFTLFFSFWIPVNRYFDKQWRPKWNTPKGGICSGSALFVKIKTIFREGGGGSGGVGGWCQLDYEDYPSLLKYGIKVSFVTCICGSRLVNFFILNLWLFFIQKFITYIGCSKEPSHWKKIEYG